MNDVGGTFNEGGGGVGFWERIDRQVRSETQTPRAVQMTSSAMTAKHPFPNFVPGRNGARILGRIGQTLIKQR